MFVGRKVSVLNQGECESTHRAARIVMLTDPPRAAVWPCLSNFEPRVIVTKAVNPLPSRRQHRSDVWPAQTLNSHFGASRPDTLPAGPIRESVHHLVDSVHGLGWSHCRLAIGLTCGALHQARRQVQPGVRQNAVPMFPVAPANFPFKPRELVPGLRDEPATTRVREAAD